MASKAVEFKSPLRGINKNASWSDLDPAYSADMLNVLPFDRDNRMRLNQRTGTSKMYENALSNSYVQMLGQVQRVLGASTVVPTDLILEEVFADYYDPDDGTHTDVNTASGGVWRSALVATVNGGRLTIESSSSNTLLVTSGGQFVTGSGRGAVYTPALVLGRSYVVKARVAVVSYGGGANEPVKLAVRVNPAQIGSQQDVIGVSLHTTAVAMDAGGTPLDSHTFAAALDPGPGVLHDLEIRVNGDAITVWVDGVQYLSATSSVGSGTGIMVAAPTTTASLSRHIESVTIHAGGWPASFVEPVVIAVAGGGVFSGGLETISASSGGSNVLTNVRFPTYGVFENKVYITDGNSPLRVLDLTTQEVTSLSVSAGSENADTLGLNRLCTVWRGRLVLAHSANAPYNFYFSRVGDPTDWDYSQTDPAAAFAGNASITGRIGEPILALIPFSEDQLLIAGDHTLWMVRGDPADGGSIDLVSDSIGIQGSHAWTKAPDGTVYFVGTGGLYRMGPGGYPEAVGDKTYTDYFANINRGTHHITMAWDRDRHGTFIFVTAINSGSSMHLWYDLRMDALFPIKFPDNHGPLSVVTVDGPRPTDRAILLGCRDGYIRKLDETALTDDGTAISSHALIGPFKASDVLESTLQWLDVILGEPSGTQTDADFSVTATVQAGQTVERAAVNPKYTRTRTFNTPRRHAKWINRIRGNVFFLKLSNAVLGKTWSFEKAVGMFMPNGLVRRRQ